MSAPRGSLLLLDLDGPLLDVRPRYHALHVSLVTGHGRPLPPHEYWDLKRDRVPEAEILARAGVPAAVRPDLLRRRLESIESAGSVALDRPWPWALETLRRLAERMPVVLVTQRDDAADLNAQLRATGLRPHFTAVVSGRGGEGSEAKARRVREAGVGVERGSVMVGDTEVDVESGRALGALTVAVRTGIRSDAHLAACAPDHLVDDLRDVVELLAAVGRRP